MAGERYFIGPGLRDKLRETIIRVDSVARKETGPTIPTTSQEMPPRGGSPLRICTFTGAWTTGSFKTVTFKYNTTTPNTASAVNLFFSLPDDGTKDCAIAKDGTAWHLIQWQWVVSQCSTATSS